MKRTIIIEMEYPAECAVKKDEIDDFVDLILKLRLAYFCSDHEIKVVTKDEFGQREKGSYEK